MDEVSTVVIPDINNVSRGDSDEFWSDLLEEDVVSALRLDNGDGGLWSGNFVPPPPRPIFLDDTATPDGLTTCDLCSWAWQEGKTFTLDTALEAPGELGWFLTMIIVSLISAVIGAIIMIIVIHCKSRMKNTGIGVPDPRSSANGQSSNRPPISIPDDKTITSMRPSTFPPDSNSGMTSNGVWSWLSRRTTTVPTQLNSPTSPAENHYTHMEEAYNGVGEALYAELDRESSTESPAYQNSAYTDPDAPASSAPSSAYYSDLSVTTVVPERAYEVVGLSTLPIWDGGNDLQKRPVSQSRLAAISETASVPSDYV